MNVTIKVFAVAIIVFLGFGVAGVIGVSAVDQPYVPPPPAGSVAWDDNLIGQKMAPLFSDDPNPYVTDGRFYDVGRLPAPLQGNPTDYGDYRFRVTHIKFDWKKNFTSVANPDGTTSIDQSNPGYQEGFTLMYDQFTNLAHVDDQKLKGEWIYKYFTPDAPGRSEPALYVTDKQCKLKVRIECAAPVKYAYVGAKELRDPQPAGTANASYPRNWLDVDKTPVSFIEKLPGKVWVSQGEQTGSDDQGNPIYSEYVELPLVGPTKSQVDRSDIIWQWYVDRVNSTNPLPEIVTNEWIASVKNAGRKDGWAINKSGEYATHTIPDDQGGTQTVEIVLPHRFYTVLDAPKYPWYSSEDASDREKDDGKQKPWVEALDFAIVTPACIELRGQTAIASVATKVTEFCYSKYRLSYDFVNGSALYVYYKANGVDRFLTGNAGSLKLDLHLWITKGYFPVDINCYDQALTLTAMTALIGGGASYQFLEPFGYIYPSDFVGDDVRGNDCNNPFFSDIGNYSSYPRVGDDHTLWRLIGGSQPTVRKRSVFISHAWMELNNLVYDATAGASNSNAPRTGLSRAAFRAAVIDLSHTVVSPWEDNEELAAKYTADRDKAGKFLSVLGVAAATDPGDPAAQPPRAASEIPDPDYKHGDLTKVKTEKFTIYR